MKKNLIFTLITVLAVLVMVTGCGPEPKPEPEPSIAVEFKTLTANGAPGSSNTNQLTLTFSDDIPDLAAGDIILSGLTVTKGNLNASKTSAGVYTLGISGLSAGGTLSVTVVKAGYAFTPALRTVTVNYANPNFTTVAFSSVTADGDANSSTTQLTLTFNAAITDLSADDITLTGVNNVVKGDLTAGAPAGTYILGISDFTSGGTLTVVVAQKSGYNITGSSKTVTIFYKAGNPNDIAVTLSSVTADGDATHNTTKLTLTFTEEIPNLAASDITLSGLTGVTRGTLSNSGEVYTLNLTVTKGGTLTVAVAQKTGYQINGAKKTVFIFFSDAFDKAVGMKELTVAGSGSLINIDTDTGIISRDIHNGSGDYGNAFGVAIPSEQLPILAGDTIVIKYIGRGGNMPLTTKKSSSLDEVTQADYATWNGDLIEHTKEIKATVYGAAIPNDYLYFQGRPNANAWELKILDITIKRGDPLKVTASVDNLKPVTGGTPLTTVETLQFTGTVSWKDASGDDVTGNFEAGANYTATIALTSKTGYTFNGIAANAIAVTSAKTVTHTAGAGATLSVTATFNPTEAPAPDKNITFTDVAADVKGKNVTITALTGDDAGKGYHVVTTEGYGSAWTYFKVTFDTGFKLSDYTKIDFDIIGITSSAETSDLSGYKDGYMMAYATEADITALSALSDIEHLVFKETPSASGTGIEGLDSKATRTVSVRVPTGTDLNTVWIAYRVGGSAGYIWEISNIKFYN